eukprot:TRINITY_DN15451_c0_g1_i1.p1 TRINITY_DN15451_c0_g1~~TRINITY_DN15451_c0_g1_i1.p1  ORF type:complete len:126 (+),score=4.05 TRINITY_DN15451_c0_g1_i1:309-686(+)
MERICQHDPCPFGDKCMFGHVGGRRARGEPIDSWSDECSLHEEGYEVTPEACSSPAVSECSTGVFTPVPDMGPYAFWEWDPFPYPPPPYPPMPPLVPAPAPPPCYRHDPYNLERSYEFCYPKGSC